VIIRLEQRRRWRRLVKIVKAGIRVGLQRTLKMLQMWSRKLRRFDKLRLFFNSLESISVDLAVRFAWLFGCGRLPPASVGLGLQSMCCQTLHSHPRPRLGSRFL
jgi:hypothetical protein